MARHSRRVASLVAKLGNPDDMERARLERMADEHIEREPVEDAVKCGFDPDVAAADPSAALSSLETHCDCVLRGAAPGGNRPG
ncbi:MAG: hypothetical protein WA989_01545 [Henriciella sp.]|uniref:hypothetical protein n=1 Tax=Henriciella sp. TaxID=1968823 RepID=UPI003C73877D